MASESFFYRETQPLFRQLETVSQRSGVSRGQAFEDFITAGVAALAAETMEDEYLSMVERHKAGRPGQRSIDLIAQMFAGLVDAMTKTDSDILGDLFQSAVSYQESGQFLTPDAVSKLMGQLTVGADEQRDDGSPLTICDPACGTGRMLLDAARQNPNVELWGTDIDARCAKITAINLGLRSHYGWVICGNSLTLENRFAYRIAPFYHESPNGRRRGAIREVPVEQTPVLQAAHETMQSTRDLFAGQTVEESAEHEPPTQSSTGTSNCRQPGKLIVATQQDLPAIMEIPRWVLRLEQHFADVDTEAESPGQRPPDTSPQGKGSRSLPSGGSLTQGELF